VLFLTTGVIPSENIYPSYGYVCGFIPTFA